MTHVERSIEVEVPVRTAYDQWTQFEEFPRFMSGVQEVRQVGDALTHWVAEIAGVRREWDAAILEQLPDEKVAWAATSGATNAGAVYFTAVAADRTQVRLTLDYEPEGLVERIGDVLDVIDRQAVADLDRFKAFIEQTGSASGGWRGTVEDGDVQAGGVSTSGATVGGAAADTGTAGGGLSGGTAGVGLSSGVSDGGATEAGVEGDLVAVGPTGDTRGSVTTEAGPARAETSYGHEDAGVRYSGDPVAVEPPSGAGTGAVTTDATTSSTASTAWPTADAASSSAGVAGFGTDTGLSSDDPASGALTGNPRSAAAGGPGGTAWTDEPVVQTGTTEATTDPVGESLADDADTTTGAGAGELHTSTGGAGESHGGATGAGKSRGGVTTGMGGARKASEDPDDPRPTA